MLRKKTLASFDLVTLKIMTMRGTTEQEIVPKDDGKAEVSFYRILYHGDADERALEARTVVPAEEVLKLLGECRVLSWDGFHGKHPRGVLDGEMFSLKVTANGETVVFADGSANFPQGFRKFRDGLRLLLETREEPER